MCQYIGLKHFVFIMVFLCSSAKWIWKFCSKSARYVIRKKQNIKLRTNLCYSSKDIHFIIVKMFSQMNLNILFEISKVCNKKKTKDIKLHKNLCYSIIVNMFCAHQCLAGSGKFIIILIVYNCWYGNTNSIFINVYI